jgi:hypothetical protein
MKLEKQNHVSRGTIANLFIFINRLKYFPEVLGRGFSVEKLSISRPGDFRWAQNKSYVVSIY